MWRMPIAGRVSHRVWAAGRRSRPQAQTRLLELLGRQITQTAVRPGRVVILPPGLNLPPGLLQAQEVMRVQTLIPKSPVERLDGGVLHGSARCDEVKAHPVLARPLGQRLPSELGPIIHDDLFGQTTTLAQGLQHLDHPLAADGGVDLNGRALARQLIEKVERPKLPARAYSSTEYILQPPFRSYPANLKEEPKGGPLLDRRGRTIRTPQWDSFAPPFTSFVASK